MINRWQNFKVADKYIFGSRNDTLYCYEIATFQYDKWKMPVQIAESRSFNFSSSRIYSLKNGCNGNEGCLNIYALR
jgi:hypothetical protein